MRIRRRATLAAAGLVAVAATSLATTPTEAATSFARISEVGIGDTIEQPSIARFGNTYEAVWVHVSGTTTKTYSLKARILSASGAAVGTVIDVLHGWAHIRDYPTILSANGQRIIAFNGTKDASGSATWDQPAQYYLTSSDGTTWTLAGGSLSPAVAPDGADGVTARWGSTSAITALATGPQVSYFTGFSPDNPATAFTGSADNTGNDALYPGAATAGSSAWIAWLSDNSATVGVNVQQVAPSLGTRKRAPNSFTNGAASPVHQGVPLVVRTGTSGPPYTAYARQDGFRVLVWRFGATSPISLTSAGGVSFVSLTSAPSGRLWVVWADSKGWHATRSNRAATHFGPVTTIGYPANANHSSFNAVGSAGPLELVSLTIPAYDNTKAAIYAAQIKPRLSCAASPTKAAPGTTIAITVKDAGDPVSGATVHFAGKTGTTNSNGVVHFTIPKSASGTLTATASHSGYTGCSTTVKVT